MAQIEIKAQEKIEQLLNNIYQKLAKHPLAFQQQRQLLPAEEQLMSNLDKEDFLYQSLLRILAIDSYCSAIVSQTNLNEQLSGMMTATLQAFNQLGDSFQKNSQKKKILQKYNKSAQTLVQSIKIIQQMFPKTAYAADQNNLINSENLDINIEESIISKLRQQNQQLRKKAESNQLQILSLQNRLTKLLKQHQGCERSQQLGNAMSSIELRQELVLRQAQIQRMNEQFTFEIEKYNTVFQAMKHELQEMKGYQNVDLIEQIELLQTQIVRLRQERDRDQIIIRQLRSDNTLFSSAGYYSPRNSNHYPQHVYQNSRYNY